MKDANARDLLAQVMGWPADFVELINSEGSRAAIARPDYKYDQYQRFGPGRRFIESLALWLNQFEAPVGTALVSYLID